MPHIALAPETKSFSGKYRVQRKGGGKARAQHPNFATAEAEACRLLHLCPDATFLILQEVARVKMRPVASPFYDGAEAEND